jgi:hypothetical protein
MLIRLEHIVQSVGQTVTIQAAILIQRCSFQSSQPT